MSQLPDDPPPRPPFDQSRASFWLVVLVMSWLLFMATVYLGSCLFIEHKECDTSGRFGEILSTILASALAYAAGRVSAK